MDYNVREVVLWYEIIEVPCGSSSEIQMSLAAPGFLKGPRVPVAALFENLKDGASIHEFLEWFPGVTRDQVEELLDYEQATLNDLALE